MDGIIFLGVEGFCFTISFTICVMRNAINRNKYEYMNNLGFYTYYFISFILRKERILHLSTEFYILSDFTL